jgi:hypothetical protein
VAELWNPTAETDSAQVATVQLRAVQVNSASFSPDACSTSAPPSPDKEVAMRAPRFPSGDLRDGLSGYPKTRSSASLSTSMAGI